MFVLRNKLTYTSFSIIKLIFFLIKLVYINVVIGSIGNDLRFVLSIESQIFPNPLYNEANIEEFIEDDIFFEITYPKELQYTYRLHLARNFGGEFPRPYNGVRLVVADPPECCSYPFNAYLLKGAVALVSRGDCSFLSKTVKAERAGAIAVIVTDNNIENDDMYIKMIDDNTNRKTNIPAAFLLGISGHMIQTKLAEKREEAAIINIPVNLSSVPIHKLNQPPWLIW